VHEYAGYNPYRYTGTYRDSQTGLYQMGSRYYSPGTGRFTQVDPLGRSVYEANRYAYVNCNPVNATDPTGLSGDCPEGTDLSGTSPEVDNGDGTVTGNIYLSDYDIGEGLDAVGVMAGGTIGLIAALAGISVGAVLAPLAVIGYGALKFANYWGGGCGVRIGYTVIQGTYESPGGFYINYIGPQPGW
jgi:RHS repeat-associated protein